MGGNVFTLGPSPLRTPRMPPHVYLATKELYSNKLKTLFVHVESPIEGPGKEDFGDVDILCANALERNSPRLEHGLFAQISELLGAVRGVEETGGRGFAAHFAVPWPGGEQEAQGEDEGDQGQRHIQLDVRVCESKEHLDWLVFRNTHGDLWTVLGAVIKPCGLTLDDKALYIRIEEMEKLDRKKARILLTHKPSEVLEFLQISQERYFEGPFGSAEDLFHFITSCRFFCASTFTKNDTWTNEQTKRQRPVYSRFFDEYIPRLVEQGRFAEQPYTRQQVRETAMARFSGVGEKYERAKEKYLPDLTRVATHNIISKRMASVAEEAEKSGDCLANAKWKKATKAIKAVVFNNHQDEGWGPVERPSLVGKDGVWDLDAARRWTEKWKGWFFEEAYLRSLQGGGLDVDEQRKRMMAYLEEWERREKQEPEEERGNDKDQGGGCED